MGIRTDEGRYVRSKSLRDSAIKRKHPLNFMPRAVASHHLISCEATRRLSSYRRKQITNKGYDVNHIKNLVILPMKEEISCQYYIPFHLSAHTDEQLVTHYESKVGPKSHLSNMMSKLEKGLVEENDDNQRKILKDDIEAIKDVLGGYHRIIGVRLARVLKGLNCNTDEIEYAAKLDNLSLKIVGDISKFRLLLIERGKYMKKGQPGCNTCRKPSSITDRVHFEHSDNAPTYELVKSFCYSGKRLKIIYEQKPSRKVLNKNG
ncbi:AHH domain-containing protein [Vibrio proteolyticus]